MSNKRKDFYIFNKIKNLYQGSKLEGVVNFEAQTARGDGSKWGSQRTIGGGLNSNDSKFMPRFDIAIATHCYREKILSQPTYIGEERKGPLIDLNQW